MTVSYEGEIELAADPTLEETKPKWRGWIHLITAPLLFITGLVLLVLTPTVAGRTGVAIYTVTSLVLFGTSAVYHRGTWQEKVALLLRRADHANIFLFIAGTYTPFALIALDGTSRIICLSAAWGIAALGVGFGITWPTAPRWLSAILYIGMGWVAVAWLPEFWTTAGPAMVILLITGGAIYSVGAVVYAGKWPNPSPTWFGFHEIFHACTMAAAICHVVAIGLVALG